MRPRREGVVDRAGSLQLADFTDFGQAAFETAGWSPPLGFTGETAHAGYGLNQHFARTYDPASGAWLSQDPYRGLLTQPETLHRYAYVGSNPVTFWDLLGFRAAAFNGTDSIPLGTGMKKQQMADAMSGPLGTQVTPVSLRDGLTVNDPKHKSVEWEKPRHVDGKPATPMSHGDSMAKNWEETVRNFGPHWQETWDNFFDNPQARTWDPVLQWVQDHAGMAGQYCGLILCVQIGSDGFGIGPAVGADASMRAGASSGDLSGLGVSVGCWAADGLGGYSSYSRDWQGHQSPDVGLTTGAGAGCSGLIMWYW